MAVPPSQSSSHKLQKKIRLGDLLVENKLISEEQLLQALAEQKRSGRKLGRVLIENGFVQEHDLLNLLATQLDLPYIDLSRFPYKAEMAKLIPETLARRYRVLALQDKGDEILVGMADPTNIFAYDELVRIIKRPIALAVVQERELLQGIDKIYQHGQEIQSLASEMVDDIGENVFDIQQLNRSVGKTEAPAVKLIETIFQDAINQKASDIHIEPDENVLRIRRRIDGVLYEQVMDEYRIASALVSRLKLMAGLDISEKRLPQDGRFDLKIRDKSVDVRVATMPTTSGESVVMRLLDHSQGMLDINSIGFEPKLLTHIQRELQRPHGIILVTGPTGSGKTTTLYAMLNELNQAEKKIITVEDPVEYQLPRINQVQTNSKIGLGFSTVLRSALRADPDIIFVGEIRDKETAEIALRAAMTGHLVLSSLHTNDAISTAVRLIDMGVEPFLVASAVNAIIAQRLVRRICDSCRSPLKPDVGQQAWLDTVLTDETKPGDYFTGSGSPSCNDTGYQGRGAIHEMLQFDDALAHLVRSADFAGFKHTALFQSSFVPLAQSGLMLAQQGKTSLAEVIRVSGWVD